jgi:hypothetical protein
MTFQSQTPFVNNGRIRWYFSFLFVDLSSLLAALPGTDAAKIPSPAMIKLLSLIQPTILTAIAVWVGVLLAPKCRLSAPAFEALARNDNFLAPLKPQMIPGLIGGLVGGLAIVLSWVLWRPFLPPEFVTRAQQLNQFLRCQPGCFTEASPKSYAGGADALVGGWRLFQGKVSQDAFSCRRNCGISPSFWFSHLPAGLGSSLTAAVVLYVVTANSAFGLIAGYLYWRKGLEAAILAHMLAHVVIVSAIHLGLGR